MLFSLKCNQHVVVMSFAICFLNTNMLRWGPANRPFEFESNLFYSNEYKLLKSIITNEAKEICRTKYSSLQSSNTLNYRRMISHRAIVSLYTVPLSAVNDSSHLTKLTSTTSKEQARPIRFENFRIGQFLSNRIGRLIRIESQSFTVPCAEWASRIVNDLYINGDIL